MTDPASSGSPLALAAPAPARLLDVPAAAAYLGLSRAAVFHKIARRELPFVKIGKRAVRLDREALDRWIQKRTVRPLPGNPTPALDPAPAGCQNGADGSRQARPQ